MSAPVILIVDDNPQIREILAINFAKEGFRIEEATDGVEAIGKANQLSPAIVLLDIMIPVLDGIEVCRQLRQFSNIPVILLTARDEDQDRSLELDLGADDYVTKPFSARDLVLRVKALLDHVPEADYTKAGLLQFPDLTIDITGQNIQLTDRVVPLTLKETELLWQLAAHPGQAFSPETLLEKVWGYDSGAEAGVVDHHIRRLRKKLAADEKTPWDIQKAWGAGYRFVVRR
jgi:two-component system, OmpR family, response regulator ResD